MAFFKGTNAFSSGSFFIIMFGVVWSGPSGWGSRGSMSLKQLATVMIYNDDVLCVWVYHGRPMPRHTLLKKYALQQIRYKEVSCGKGEERGPGEGEREGGRERKGEPRTHREKQCRQRK